MPVCLKIHGRNVNAIFAVYSMPNWVPDGPLM